MIIFLQIDPKCLAYTDVLWNTDFLCSATHFVKQSFPYLNSDMKIHIFLVSIIFNRSKSLLKYCFTTTLNNVNLAIVIYFYSILPYTIYMCTYICNMHIHTHIPVTFLKTLHVLHNILQNIFLGLNERIQCSNAREMEKSCSIVKPVGQ